MPEKKSLVVQARKTEEAPGVRGASKQEGSSEQEQSKNNNNNDNRSKQLYPKYQIKEENKKAAGKQLRPEQVVSHKYEQLMATSFIPELSILEKRIKQLDKMPEQLRHYIAKREQQ